ncbi:MAG: isoprenylcysteine carboxylmethyltransferase family protein [Candidatus Methylacidiphilales bacterium]
MTKPPFKDLLFISIQMLLFVAYLLPISIGFFTINLLVKYLFLGLSVLGFLVIILAIIQLDKNLTPFPSPKKNGNLINNGLYKFVRHPIYTGIIICTITFGVYNQNIWRIGIGVVLWILFYFKSIYEEKMLCQKFNQYIDYKNNTGRFFPFF